MVHIENKLFHVIKLSRDDFREFSESSIGRRHFAEGIHVINYHIWASRGRVVPVKSR